jgi:hypothetical protein
MRLVPKQIESYKNDRTIEEVNINNLPDVEMIYNIISEKDKVKTVKTCERMIRSSLEYKDYIKFLKDYIDMTKCSFFGNAKMDHYSKFKVEIHHSPFTLYDITMTILLKHLDEYGEINLFEVCEEVMKLHYQCRVGLIPLSTTVHKLVHEGMVFIPVQNVRGDWLAFYKEYEPYMPQDMKDKLRNIIKFSKECQDYSLLATKYTYIDVDGFRPLSLLGQEDFMKKIVTDPK